MHKCSWVRDYLGLLVVYQNYRCLNLHIADRQNFIRRSRCKALLLFCEYKASAKKNLSQIFRGQGDQSSTKGCSIPYKVRSINCTAT